MAEKKPPKRTTATRTRASSPLKSTARASSTRGTASDVTMLPAEVVVGQIKLICDNDTNVVFYRQNGKLYMAPVHR